MHVLSVPTTCRYKHCSWRPYHCFAGYQREADNCKYTVLANFEIFLIVFLLAFQWARLQKILIFSIFFLNQGKNVYIFIIYINPFSKMLQIWKYLLDIYIPFFLIKKRTFWQENKTKNKQTKKRKIYIYIYIWEVCVSIFPLYSARYIEVERDIHWDRQKTKRSYFHSYKPVSWLLIHQGIS